MRGSFIKCVLFRFYDIYFVLYPSKKGVIYANENGINISYKKGIRDDA